MQREELTELAVGSFAPGSAGFYVDSVAIGCTEPDGMEVDVLWLLWWPLANRWIERVHLTSAVAHCQVKGPVVSDAKAVHEARGLRPSCPEARAVCAEAYALASITSLAEALETAVHRRHLQAQKRPHGRMLRQRGEGWIPRHAVSPAQQQCREQRNVDVHRCRIRQGRQSDPLHKYRYSRTQKLGSDGTVALGHDGQPKGCPWCFSCCKESRDRRSPGLICSSSGTGTN